LKIKAIRCPRCKDVIYSRARHDYRCCGCGLIGVDGGFDYWKINIKEWIEFDIIDLEVNATKKELYRDWNEGINKYGIVKAKKED